MRRAMAASAFAMVLGARNWRFRLVLFFVRICRRWEQLRLNEPDEVRLKRFAAPRFVFILGIVSKLRYLGVQDAVKVTFSWDSAPSPSGVPP